MCGFNAGQVTSNGMLPDKPTDDIEFLDQFLGQWTVLLWDPADCSPLSGRLSGSVISLGGCYGTQ